MTLFNANLPHFVVIRQEQGGQVERTWPVVPWNCLQGNLALVLSWRAAWRRHLDVEDFSLKTARRGLYSWGTGCPAACFPFSILAWSHILWVEHIWDRSGQEWNTGLCQWDYLYWNMSDSVIEKSVCKSPSHRSQIISQFHYHLLGSTAQLVWVWPPSWPSYEAHCCIVEPYVVILRKVARLKVLMDGGDGCNVFGNQR